MTNIAMDERSPEMMKETISLVQEIAPELGISLADNHQSYKEYPFIRDLCVSYGTVIDEKVLEYRKTQAVATLVDTYLVGKLNFQVVCFQYVGDKLAKFKRVPSYLFHLVCLWQDIEMLPNMIHTACRRGNHVVEFGENAYEIMIDRYSFIFGPAVCQRLFAASLLRRIANLQPQLLQ